MNSLFFIFMASYLILQLIWIFFCVVSLSFIPFCLCSFYLFLFFYHLCFISFPPFCCSLCLCLFLCALPSPLCFCISFLFSSFHPLPFFPSLPPLRPQGETVHRDGEWDGQWGEVSGRSQPKVSGQLPRLPPALQQPQPQSQQLPALPPRYSPAVLRVFTSVD